MPNFRVTLVNYRDCTVEAPDLATARRWAQNREPNAPFCDPVGWSISDVTPDDYEDAIIAVQPDGTFEYVEYEEEEGR